MLKNALIDASRRLLHDIRWRNRVTRASVREDALADIVPRLDPRVCATCTARIFEECAAQPGPPPREEPPTA